METTGQEVGRIETRLRQLGTRLDRMLAKADEAGIHALRDQITHAKDKHAVVQSKLNAFRAAHGEKWDHFRGSVEIAWRDLDSACKALAP
jgi:hypothetical protein